MQNEILDERKPTLKRLLSVHEAIFAYGIGRSKFYREVAAGRIQLRNRPMVEACKRAKIKPAISFHVLRHTHGSTLAMRGVPMPVIAQQLGHADTRMTEKHYAHLSGGYVADTIRAHFPALGIAESGAVQIRVGRVR
jgi:integrase